MLAVILACCLGVCYCYQHLSKSHYSSMSI